MPDDDQERQHIEHHVAAVVQGLFQRAQVELIDALVRLRMMTEERDAARAELAQARAEIEQLGEKRAEHNGVKGASNGTDRPAAQ